MFGIKKIILILFVLIFTLTSASFSFFINNSQAAEAEEINSNREWITDQTIDKNIIIKAGVTLVIRKGVKLTFDHGSIEVKGNMIVSGTTKEPVILRKAEDSDDYLVPNYSITVKSGGKLTMRNADISGAGTAIYLTRNTFFINTANAASYRGGIQMSGGTLDVQSSNFHDNNVAIFINHDSNRKVTVNRSKFSNNDRMDVGFDSYLKDDSVNFKYNWWGNAEGPAKTCYAGHSCYYEKMEGDGIDFSDWLTKESFRDPVIIIPGILGSWKWTDDGEWKIDPIFKTYDSLIETFEKNGYEENENLFVFPYQWRDSNVNNAKLLRDKITAIKQKANWPKVDLVAHSMGGLLAREYVESDYYPGDIDQLITLGTPHSGAPEDYLTWDGGHINFSGIGIINEFAQLIFKQEARESGFDSIFDYLHKMPIKSVQELLPVYDYLYSVDLNKKRSYINEEHYPKNAFLENLNSGGNLEKLNNVEFTNIIGKLDSDKTIDEIRVGKPSLDENSLWAHGYPEKFDSISGGRGLEYGNGDGTVPSESSESIVSDEKIILKFSHAELPAKGADLVYETITGNSPYKDVKGDFIDEILTFFVFSPIDIQVISPSGEKIGKDFSDDKNINEIDGAYYTGFDTENEFITIPNPEDGEYKIIVQGMGTGNFEIEAAKFSENGDDSLDIRESAITFEGVATNGSQNEFVALIDGDAVINSEKKSMQDDSENNNIVVLQNSNSDENDSDNSGHKNNKKKKTVIQKIQTIAARPYAPSREVIFKKNDASLFPEFAKSEPRVAGESSENIQDSEEESASNLMVATSILVVIFLLGYLLKGVGILKYFKKL